MMIEQNLILWLQNWHYQFFGSSQDDQAINIYNVDNPGWRIIIDLKGTSYENKPFQNIRVELTETDWYHCFLRDGRFEGAGGACNLLNILTVFRNWVECEKNIKAIDSNNELLRWLQKWYDQYCDGDWEHNQTFHIHTTSKSGWHVKIDLQGTECEDKPFESVDVNVSETDWYCCFLREGKFIGAGGACNLINILNVFKEWASIHEASDLCN